MKAGRLRHRVTVQSATQTQDPATGQMVKGWGNHIADLPAAMIPVKSSERYAAGGTQEVFDCRWLVRWHPDGIHAGMRLLHDSQIFDIMGVVPDKTDRRSLLLECKRGLNDGR